MFFFPVTFSGVPVTSVQNPGKMVRNARDNFDCKKCPWQFFNARDKICRDKKKARDKNQKLCPWHFGDQFFSRAFGAALFYIEILLQLFFWPWQFLKMPWHFFKSRLLPVKRARDFFEKNCPWHFTHARDTCQKKCLWHAQMPVTILKKWKCHGQKKFTGKKHWA